MPLNSSLTEKLNPENPYRLGLEHLRQGISESAVEYFRDLLKNDPRDSQALLYLGIAYCRQRKFTPALLSFLKALKINPSNIAARENLAELYVVQNLPGEAAEFFLETANLYEKENQVGKSLEIYNKMERLELTPGLRSKLHHRKQKLLSLISPSTPTSPDISLEVRLNHLLEDFKEDLAEVIESQDYEGHYELGIIYRETGFPDEALNAFRKALPGLEPRKKVLCYDYLGLCLVEKGAYEAAIAQFQEGLKYNSETEVKQDLESHLVQTYEKWEETKK